MSDPHIARGAHESGSGKPRNKRRFGGKNPKRKQKPSVLERLRAQRQDKFDDDYLEDLDDDFELEDDDESAEYDGYEDGWLFEDLDEQ